MAKRLLYKHYLSYMSYLIFSLTYQVSYFLSYLSFLSYLVSRGVPWSEKRCWPEDGQVSTLA